MAPLKLLTITVPSYNMEKLLPNCLESCLYPGAEKDIEIIVVNDGSKDGTLTVAREYQSRYPDVISVIDKENGGHGSGINAGIQNACGKYFKVLDADDWFDTASLQALVEVLRSTDAHMVTNSFVCVNARTMKPSSPRSPIVGSLTEGEHDFSAAAPELLVRMHSVTWRTDILRGNVEIDEHRFYVDMEYISFPIPMVERVYVTQLPLYMYRLGDNGQSVSIASMQKHIDDHLTVMDNVLAYITAAEGVESRRSVLDYLNRLAAEMVANQCLIYLSYPASKGMKQKFIDLENMLREKHPGVYEAVSHRAVLMLRKSRYTLFPLASLLVRLTRK